MRTLIVAWSGGVDSTAALFWALRQPDARVIGVHVAPEVPHTNPRSMGQEEAVEAIAEAVAVDYPDFHLETISLPFGPQTRAGDTIWAFAGVGLWLAQQSFPATAIVWGRHAGPGGHSPEREAALERVFRGLCGDSVTVFTPLQTMNKLELSREIPYSILGYTWSCLYGSHNGAAVVPCGRCRACHARSGALASAVAPGVNSEEAA